MPRQCHRPANRGNHRSSNRERVSLNHYPRHIGDITRDTFGLSLTEFGAYDRLIDAYYASESPLPLDKGELYRLCGATSKHEKASVDYVTKRYFTEQSDGWHQKRCDEEIAKCSERIESARQNGLASGRARQSARSASIEHPSNDRSTTVQRNATSHKPVTSNHIKASTKTKAATALPDWLAPELWAQWVEQRRLIKAPLTPAGERLGISRLSLLRDAGHDPKAIIEQSIMSGWKGLFPVGEDSRRNSHKDAKTEARQAVARAIFEPFRTQIEESKNAERDIDGESRRLAEGD